MYDVIVVGARCAGSPAAMLLARRGYRVLLVDKAAFPSDTMSTHFVQTGGVARLDRWGLLDQVKASNCPPIPRLLLDFGGTVFPVPVPPDDGFTESYCPRRTVLDTILVKAAVDAGAELREHVSVQELLFDGDQVIGIRARTHGGDTFSEQARIVIGADGMRSFVARGVQAPEYHVRGALGCGYYSYWSGVPVDGTEIYWRERRAILVFATNDGLTCIGTEWPNAEFDEFRADIEGNLLKTFDLTPTLGDRVRAGRREEKYIGTRDLQNFFRKPYGPGWALVGDAGYHKDPITGTGISDAFRDVEFLVEALDDGFSGRRPLDAALAQYERRRNEAALPMYELTCQLAALDKSPMEVAQIFAAMQAPRAGTAAPAAG